MLSTAESHRYSDNTFEDNFSALEYDAKTSRPTATIHVKTDNRVEVGNRYLIESSAFYPSPYVILAQEYDNWVSIDPSVKMPRDSTREYTSTTAIEWEGVVEKISVDTFEARLRSIKGGQTDHIEYAEFDVSDVPEGDKNLLKPGGIFRWTIGVSTQHGTKKKFSSIYFRRMPAWTKRSLANSTQEITNLIVDLEWD